MGIELTAFLPSVAEAVLGYALERLDPAERVTTWLKGEPARLAFQKALARAYNAFHRQYPELTAELFNQSFLEKEGAPELAKLLTRHEKPDPAQLASLWARSLGASTADEADKAQAVMTPAVDFLRWLEGELKSEAALQPLFDSRALESLPTLETKLDTLTAELRHALDAALKTATSAPITTLNDYYIPPDDVFQRVAVQDFVGREWLTAKVDDFLQSNASGVFVLVAEAGLGKTSFLAHLVNERRYLHLFGEQMRGDANLDRALLSLGSQIVSRYQLAEYKDRNTLPEVAKFPDFVARLLRSAARELTAGEKIVIVCDALDEAGTAPGGNVFGLPEVLPESVYLLLSQRPVDVRLNFREVTPHIERLEAKSSENQQDLHEYLRVVAQNT